MTMDVLCLKTGGDFLTSQSCGVSIRVQDIQEIRVKEL